MAKAPYFDFAIGDKSVDQLGIRHLISSIEYEEEIGKFDKVKMVIKSGPEIASAYYLLKHGGIFQLSMGYYNGLLKKMGILFYQGVEPNFEEQTITINFADYIRAMNIGEKDRVLKGKTLEQVVQAVVADYAVLEVGVIDSGDLVLSETISQSKKSDFNLMQDIASSLGMTWRLDPTSTPGIWSISLKKINFDDDSSKYESFFVYPDKENQDITENIHLKSFKPKSNVLGDIPSRVTIESNNPNQPIQVDSKVYDTAICGEEVRGSEIVFTVFGQVSRIQFYENVTDEEAAQVIADQMLQMDELKFVQAKNVQLSEGNAGVRKGQRRHVVPHGIPLFSKVFEGDYLVSKTKHKIDTKEGYNTWVDLSRESLTMPPPPELTGGGGGGGGQPIVVWITQSTIIRGQYVSFDENGVIQYGAVIPASVIESNEYWMSKIRTVTGPVIGSLGLGTVGSLAQTSIYAPLGPTSGTGAFNDPTVQIATGVSMAAAQGVAIYIDFPDQWSNMPLADDVRQPSFITSSEYEVDTYEFDSELLNNLNQYRQEQEFNARAQTLTIGGGGVVPE